jgi:CBS domain-containing protein
MPAENSIPLSVASMEDGDFQLELTTEPAAMVDAARPECVSPQTSIRDVMQMLVDKNRGAALICENDLLLGIFTERDALRLMAEAAQRPAAIGPAADPGAETLDDPWSAPISSVMTANPACLSTTESVADAITKMAAGGYRRLPVIDDHGKPLAVVKVSSILNYLVEHFPKVIYTLPPAPHHKTQEREGA